MTTSARSYYEDYWTRPGSYADPLTVARVELFRSVVPRGARVLDAGCGDGSTSLALGALGYEPVGVDVALGAVRRARESGVPRVAQCMLDAGLPFRSGSFDAVFCSEVLEHLFAPWVAAQEFRRLVRPGGVVFVSVPYHGMAKNLAVAALGFERHFPPDGEHIRFFTRASLGQMLERSGLLVRRFVGLGRAWPFHKSLVAIAEGTAP